MDGVAGIITKWAALMGAVLIFTGSCGMALFRPDPAGWLLFDMSRLRDYYYDPDAIERTSPTTVKVRIATVAKDSEGRDWEVAERMKRGLPFGGYERYRSSEDVYSIDCGARTFQTLSGTDYDEDGKILNSITYADPRWEPIPDGSVLAVLVAFKSVCP